MRPVTAKLANYLRIHTHHKEYDEDCPSHPGGICTTDLKKLLDLVKVAEGRSLAYQGTDPRQEWAKLELSDIVVPDPEVSSDECDCPLCHLGHYNPVGKAGSKKVKAVLNPTGGLLDVELGVKVKKTRKVRCTFTLHVIRLLS